MNRFNQLHRPPVGFQGSWAVGTFTNQQLGL